MFILMMAQDVTNITTNNVECLSEITRKEQSQDDKARQSKKRAGALPILEPDDDQLPDDAPVSFDPQIVTLSYRINANGRVADCKSLISSAIATFNKSSCDLLIKHHVGSGVEPSRTQEAAVIWTPRAIRPERRLCNNNGGTIPVSSDRWFTSDVFPRVREQTGSALIALEIGTAGQVGKCKIVTANIDKELQSNICKMAVQRAFVLPAVNDQGQFVPARLIAMLRFKSSR